jgi:hypothetical protein
MPPIKDRYIGNRVDVPPGRGSSRSFIATSHRERVTFRRVGALIAPQRSRGWKSQQFEMVTTSTCYRTSVEERKVIVRKPGVFPNVAVTTIGLGTLRFIAQDLTINERTTWRTDSFLDFYGHDEQESRNELQYNNSYLRQPVYVQNFAV